MTKIQGICSFWKFPLYWSCPTMRTTMRMPRIRKTRQTSSCFLLWRHSCSTPPCCQNSPPTINRWLQQTRNCWRRLSAPTWTRLYCHQQQIGLSLLFDLSLIVFQPLSWPFFPNRAPNNKVALTLPPLACVKCIKGEDLLDNNKHPPPTEYSANIATKPRVTKVRYGHQPPQCPTSVRTALPPPCYLPMFCTVWTTNCLCRRRCWTKTNVTIAWRDTIILS